jgi:DNA-directed RNA polymerase subunit H
MKQNNQLDMLLETKNETLGEKTSISKKVYIRYYLAKTIRPANVQEMIDDLFVLTETLKKTDTLYIIIKDNVNETLINELKDIWERDGIFIVIESIKCLQFNILNHVLVPPHNIIDEDEVKKVITRYNITDKVQFPDISRFDPVARAICLRPGQVCQILRPSKTAITTNYYRICV